MEQVLGHPVREVQGISIKMRTGLLKQSEVYAVMLHQLFLKTYTCKNSLGALFREAVFMCFLAGLLCVSSLVPAGRVLA